MINNSKFKESLLNFWILHCTGWFIHWVFGVIVSFRFTFQSATAFIWGFFVSFIGWLSTLIIRYIYKRMDYNNYSILQLAVVIVFFSFIASNIWYGLDHILDLIMISFDQQVQRRSFQGYLYWLNRSVAFTLSWSTFYFVINIWKNWKQQEEITEKANLLAQSAQLQMLRYQLNPHFLFNSLNSVRALISEDTKKAKDMITELSEFLRYSLIAKNYSNVPLSNEIEAIKHYFEIEKKRFEEKLEVTFNIDSKAEEFPVLSFLVHPLVENAVKYGMQTSQLPLKISINAYVEQKSLFIEVNNSGRWLENGKYTIGNGTGTGLKNVQKRLENAFPNNHEFNIVKDENQVKVQIKIGENNSIKNEESN